MVAHLLRRRHLLGGLAGIGLLPTMARAADVIELDWDDLRPENDPGIPNVLQGFIDHENAPLVSQQPVSSGVRSDWNGQIVKLPGFVVPIEHRGTRVTAFILVPYVGACVHVPPPPANQLVFVTAEIPYESAGLFAPVNVTGRFSVSSISTQLGDIGYALSADKIEAFQS